MTARLNRLGRSRTALRGAVGVWCVFYAAFPTILIDDVELLGIRSVTDGDDSSVSASK